MPPQHPSDRERGVDHEHRHGAGAPAIDPDADPRSFWEARYGGDQVWSGRVNATTAAVVAGLGPAMRTDGSRRRALDLGCGEGGDVVHLAEAGWDALGVDLSEAAIARARRAARERGLQGPARFMAADLSGTSWHEDVPGLDGSGFDLVTASFFQSPVALDRARALRRAAGLLAPGGHLLLVSHAAPPSWAPAALAAHGDFPSPESELATLGIPAGGDAGWEVVLGELQDRPATAPDGTATTLTDTVVLVRRRG